jgi:hypothetical protein
LWGGTCVTRYCGHFWPIVQPQMIDEGDCGAIGGMKIGRGKRSTRIIPAPAPFCPPQIPLDQTRARTRAAAVGSQRLTAWAMARPRIWYTHWKDDKCIQNFSWKLWRDFFRNQGVDWRWILERIVMKHDLTVVQYRIPALFLVNTVSNIRVT